MHQNILILFFMKLRKGEDFILFFQVIFSFLFLKIINFKASISKLQNI
jgi:hypothetical protein